MEDRYFFQPRWLRIFQLILFGGLLLGSEYLIIESIVMGPASGFNYVLYLGPPMSVWGIIGTVRFRYVLSSDSMEYRMFCVRAIQFNDMEHVRFEEKVMIVSRGGTTIRNTTDIQNRDELINGVLEAAKKNPSCQIEWD